LSANWRTNPIASRQIGDQWLDQSSSALLRVPSAIGQGQNYLLNPAHLDAARVVVAETLRAPFDPRLLK
jgi:RES domain-containing protein